MRGLRIPPRQDDFTADPVELFFDLTYVYAFSQLVWVLVHDPTWLGVGRVALLFTLMWIPWSQFHWSANAVSGNTRPVRLWFLVATIAAIPMGASVTTAFGDGGPVFAISSTVILAMGLVVMVRGLEPGSPVAASLRWYARPNIVAMAIVVGVAFVPGWPRPVAWIGAVLVVVVGGMLRVGERDWIVRAGHFAERHGLIVIVALGEVVVATGIGVNDALTGEAGQPVNPGGTTVLTLTVAAAFAGLLWWSYFDRPSPAWEHGAESVEDSARGRYARDVWSLWHVPIVLGIVVCAAAVEEIALHPGDEVPLAFRVMLAGGLTGFVGGVLAAVRRAFGIVGTERLVGLACVMVTLFALPSASGLMHLLIVDLVLVVTLVVEQLRVEGDTDVSAMHSSHG